MNSYEYVEKFGYLFWNTKKNEIYKGGNAKDLNILQNIKFRENKIILDIGGGNGFFSNWIKKNYKFKKVYNIEINKLLAKESKNKYKKITTINKNILDLNLDHKVDVILFFNSFQYIEQQHYKELFYKLNILLKNNGIILINKNWSNKHKNYTFYQTLKLKLIKIKENYFSKNFKFFLCLGYLFHKLYYFHYISVKS